MLRFSRVKLHLQLAFKKHESKTVYYYNCKKIFTGKNKCYAQNFKIHCIRFYVNSMIIDIF